MSDYIHNVPGRLRVRITAIRENPLIGDQIKELLTNIWGITSVSVRSTTGSVIITYEPQILQADRILDFLTDHVHLEVTNLAAIHRPLQTALYRAAEVIVWEALSRAASKVLNGSYLSILTTLL
jgi:copper chaperone CopZ